MNLAWLTEEVEEVSQGYARRHEINRDSTWFLLKLQEEVGELTQAFLMRSGQARSKGCSVQEIEERFRSELADVLCHVLLLARHHGVDVEEAIERKWLVWRPTGRPPPSRSRSVGRLMAEATRRALTRCCNATSEFSELTECDGQLVT